MMDKFWQIQLIFLILATMLSLGIFYFFPQTQEWSTKKYIKILMAAVFIILTTVYLVLMVVYVLYEIGGV